MLQLLYPPRCLGCGELVESDFGLCGRCWRDTPFIGGTVCDSCGVPLPGQSDGERLDCDDCMQTPRPWARGAAVLFYEDLARKLVLGLKHGDRQDIARSAAHWMVRLAAPLIRPETLVVPVPLHWSRLLRRRYNQSALLSQALAQEMGLDHCPDALVRLRRTDSLDHKSPEARAELLDGAIGPHPRHGQKLADRPVLLIDDVMTSGATLSACTRACQDAGANEVSVLVLARAAKRA